LAIPECLPNLTPKVGHPHSVLTGKFYLNIWA
jgi:hypothetical protein